MTAAGFDARLSVVETELRAVNGRIEQMNRSIDRMLPQGEAIAEIRTQLTAAAEDVKELRADLAALRAQIAADAKDARKLAWSTIGLIGAAIVTAIGGIFAAGSPV